MSTYGQWRTATDKGTIRRVTWVFGTEAVLIEEVIDLTKRALSSKSLELISLTAGADPEQAIWSAVNQYSLDPSGRRLVIIRNAELLAQWSRLKLWLDNIRYMSNTWLIFVSNEDDFARVVAPDGRPTKEWAEHLGWLKDRRDAVVRCMPLKEDDAVAWLQTFAPSSITAARYLLSRVEGDLRLARNVALKGAVLDAELSNRLIDVLVAESITNEFEDALIHGDKRKAFAGIEQLPELEISALLGRLDSRLDFLAKLHSALRKKQTLADIGREGALPIFLARRYMGVAKMYDSKKIAKARIALYMADSPVQRGFTRGAIETLVALW